MPAKSSAELLTKLWERFVENVRARGGLTVSMRKASELYLDSADPSLLAKWTKPGERKNWRIPLGRIPDTAAKLGATNRELDELMWARLAELQADDPEHEVFTFALWVRNVTERSNQLLPDEAQVLAAYRQAKTDFALPLLGSDAESDALRRVFHHLLQKAEVAQVAEHDELQADEVSDERWAEIKTKRDALVTDMARKNRAAQDKAASENRRAALRSGMSLERAVRRYLEDLKKAIKRGA